MEGICRSCDFKNEKYAGDILLQKFLTTDHISHRAVRNECREVPAYYIENHHTPIVPRATFDRVQRILLLRSQGSCTGRRSSTCIQYPLGQKLKCPYCGSTLHQRTVSVQVGRGKAWCCEVGEYACRNFVLRSEIIEKALLNAYKLLDVEVIAQKERTAKSEKARRWAERTIAAKKKHPVFDRVDYYWVDDLIDHIEIGAHSITPSECRRKEERGETYMDDRTISVFWRCGLRTVMASGIDRDRDDPRYIAGLYFAYLEKHDEQRKKAEAQVLAGQNRAARKAFANTIEVNRAFSAQDLEDTLPDREKEYDQIREEKE